MYICHFGTDVNGVYIINNNDSYYSETGIIYNMSLSHVRLAKSAQLNFVG